MLDRDGQHLPSSRLCQGSANGREACCLHQQMSRNKPSALLGWLWSGIVVEQSRFYHRSAQSLTESRGDIGKLPRQPLCLGSGQTTGLSSCLLLPPHTKQSLGHGLRASTSASPGCQHHGWGGTVERSNHAFDTSEAQLTLGTPEGRLGTQRLRMVLQTGEEQWRIKNHLGKVLCHSCKAWQWIRGWRALLLPLLWPLAPQLSAPRVGC